MRRDRIDLSGEWRFAMDPLGTGENFCGGWYELELPLRLTLPGTTGSNRMGVQSQVRDKDSVGDGYMYIGPAWYQREVEIPEAWRGKRVFLTLGRTARTTVWLDDVKIGDCDTIQAPQVYELGAPASPGGHVLTIRVDNAARRPLQYGRRVNNGIEEEVALYATDAVYLRDLVIRPDTTRKRADVRVTVVNRTGVPARGSLNIAVAETKGAHTLPDKRVQFLVEGEEKRIWLELYMGEEMCLWDEYEPHLYQMDVQMRAAASGGAYRDGLQDRFGMRRFTRQGMQFDNNGRKVFLRGDLASSARLKRTNRGTDAAAGWREIMAQYKAYGINHLRFHTHVPPKAAFDAADEMGLYLQPEMALWAWVCFPEEKAFEPLLESTLKEQGERILSAFGNHPSFVMMTLGNEIEGDSGCLGRVIAHLRAFDPTRLYAQGSNNNLNDPFPLEGDDFFISNKARKGHLMIRGSCAHADYPVGQVQQDDPPSTLRGYGESLEGYDVPMIGHEVGQYETSPNFEDLKLFPEDAQPNNLVLFREAMERRGLLPLEKPFFRDSGKLSALCYREDLEMYYRTPGMGGFQLLSMSDALGQGSSIVGIWNAFGQSKGMVSAEEWKRSCNDRVLLAGYEKYVWESGETFRARVQLFNYGRDALDGARVAWSLRDGDAVLADGALIAERAPQGALTTCGEIAVPLTGPTRALMLRLEIAEASLENEYPIWRFGEQAIEEASGVTVVRDLEESGVAALERGETVLLLARNIPEAYAVEGFFASNFWSYDMFARMSLERGVPVMPGTLGLSIDADHPIFQAFPTGTASDWQWWRLTMRSTAVVLDDLPEALAPIVRSIDNPMRCHRLGVIFEAKVGAGRLLVAAIDLLPMIERHPEARALYNGLLAYAASGAFDPSVSLSSQEVRRVLCCEI